VVTRQGGIPQRAHTGGVARGTYVIRPSRETPSITS
jgi:hypothetical protein